MIKNIGDFISLANQVEPASNKQIENDTMKNVNTLIPS